MNLHNHPQSSYGYIQSTILRMLRNFILLIYLIENEETNVQFSSSLKEKRKFAHLRFDDIGKPETLLTKKIMDIRRDRKGGL